MANVVKVQALFGILKDGNPVKFDHILKTMNVSKGTAMCLICALRNDYGADIDTIRDGRQASDYVLKNAAEIADRVNAGPVKGAKPNKVAKKPKVAKTPRVVSSVVKKTSVKPKKNDKLVEDDGSVPVLDAEMEISEISDSELADIKSQLGLA